MSIKYRCGEEIKAGDRVLLHGEPGHVELVADPADPLSDPHDWYIETIGGGVMIIEPKHFGRVFLQDAETMDDLVFVARGSDGSANDSA